MLIQSAVVVDAWVSQEPQRQGKATVVGDRKLSDGEGTTRTVNFNAAGISYIFCNIHPEMSAVVVVLKTPYYGISNDMGEVSISKVSPGRYELNVWHERCLPDSLKAESRAVVVSSSAPSLGEIRLAESGDLLKNHKNMYGRDYETPSSSPYEVP